MSDGNWARVEERRGSDGMAGAGADADADGPIVGVGRSEAQWADSPWLASLPTLAPAELLAGCGALVVVSPHPDDETLGAGGLIAAAAQAGVDVHIVAVTDGELCYPGHPRWTPARLAALRRAELAQAAAALGVAPSSIRRLGVPDNGVAAAHDAVRDAVRGVVDAASRRAEPLVVAPWAGDGHPDHAAVAHAVADALAGGGARHLAMPVWAWHWSPTAAGGLTDTQGWRVALGADVLRRKATAIDAFASQTGGLPGLDAPVLPASVLARFRRPFEVFVEPERAWR